ncbi:hypothetical protein VSP10_11030 [Myroides odoratimimus]|uniref:Uncharacterized protein n=2 Tax=Myroides odoratimimus TaxID=76832 RepID=A0A0S7E9K0_9FLAO|nr:MULTISPECIES: hypothetical protein [Myroides]AJA67629.1 hypothetical protein MYRA21_0419 [Myroides sp. A21]ALU24926.1 hypothetical protein AS202_01515 [Myroides odoratimimus]APA90950.1 hypothetical protein BK054_01615 [Myroides sp. ZB35]EHO05795.1 hypothetical protein HMPREF9712_03371 [Myroides odoratimimus CCUG 10230]EKB02292.1 hypothetical protein HMPREF9711_03498 [Myroides odoratimimus CCUG 3837]
MNRLVRVLGIVVIGVSLFACKDDKDTSGAEGEVIETVVTDESTNKNKVEEEDTTTPWQNLYEQEPAILKSTEKIFKIDNKKAVTLMDESNKISVSKDGLETVLAALKTTAAKDYLGEDFNKAVIANGGTGVVVRVDVSPNAKNDGSNKRGNYYQFTIYENYEDRIVTVGTFIFDVRTLSFYEMDIVEADYVPLKYAVSMKKSLAEIVQN